MSQWKGKTALVTGASAGIGYAITQALVTSSINVIACARNPASLEELKSKLPSTSGKLVPIKCDLVEEEEILSMFKCIESQFGHVDILINNAAIGVLGDLVDGQTDAWRQMFQLNILATSICIRETLKLLEKDGIDNGHIININSTAGHVIGMSNVGLNFYSGTKHMLTALTKALYTELNQKNSKIRVTSLSPGLVNTRLIEELKADKERGETFNFNFQALEAKDIADGVLYILGAPSHVCIRELTIVPNGQPMCDD